MEGRWEKEDDTNINNMCPGLGFGEAGHRLRIQVSHLTKLKFLLTERKQGEEADDI